MNVTLTLTIGEQNRARELVLKIIKWKKREAKNRIVLDKNVGENALDNEDNDLAAYGCEILVARLLGFKHNDKILEDFYNYPDVGSDMEVKWNQKAWGGLFMRPGNSPRYTYVLCIGEFPTFTIVGCARGIEIIEKGKKVPGRVGKNGKSLGDAWVLNQRLLHNISNYYPK